MNWGFVQYKVSKDVKADDEEGVRVKEQAILDLGALLTQTKKAKGNYWALDRMVCIVCFFN